MAASVTLELEGRSYGIAPFKIAELRKAAPYVDRMNTLAREAKARKEAGDPPSFEGAMELFHCAIEILAVGLAKVDPELTVEKLEEMLDPSYLESLQTAVFELLKASGMQRGEATALST